MKKKVGKNDKTNKRKMDDDYDIIFNYYEQSDAKGVHWDEKNGKKRQKKIDKWVNDYDIITLSRAGVPSVSL